MTVAELIEVLSLLNPEATVVTHDESGDLNRRVIVEAVSDAKVWDMVDGWISGIDVVSITNY